MIKKIIIVLAGLWILLVSSWISLSAVLILKTDDIGKYLILNINQIQNGELTVGEVRISPVKQFPNFSVILSDVKYFENKSVEGHQDRKPIAKIDNFYCGFELLKLINKQLKVSSVLFNGGAIDIIIYPDSTINLLNALKLKSESGTNNKSLPHKTKSEESDLSIIIDELKLENVRLSVNNNPENKHSAILVKDFQSDFEYKHENINFNFLTTLIIEELKINENLSINDQIIKLNVESHLDKKNGLQIEKGELEIETAKFNFNGYFNPARDGELSLQVESDGSLGILSLFVREEVAKKVTRGDFYFKGFVEGKIFSEFPLVNIHFGINNVQLINPVTKGQIKNLNLKGNFNSGRQENLSEAFVNIDTLYAKIENGFLNFSGRIDDFTHPKFNINLFLDADVTGADDVFKLAGIDSINGRIILKDQFIGEYDSESKKLKSNTNISEMVFEDFAFIIPGTIRFDKINGTISRNGDEFYLKELQINSENTDLNINGDIRNIQYLLFDVEKEISANLSIKSKVFDLPNFLFFDPSIKRDFNHRILNLDLLVDAKTTTSKATKFKSFPEIEFNIKHLDATAENFLPRLKIQSGKFKISENLLGFNLKFDKFETKFLDGNFNFTGEYNSSKYQPFYIKLKTNFKKISPSMLFYNEGDTIPEFLAGKLSGSFFTEFQFPLDSTILKFINLKDGNLIYYSPTDTIELKSLRLNFSNIYYNDKLNPNPLATLSTSGKFATKEIITKYFVLKNGELNIKADNGEYEVGSSGARLFGENARGSSFWKLKPFADIPEYQIKYDVKEFFIEEMLSVFLEDTIVTGPLSLHLDISSRGSDWETIRNNTLGSLNLSGKNLTFYGLNADELIEKFKRSQSFNLIDLGAVMLAGPVGIAVTKGSDYASILIFNSGESSKINKLVSNWDIRNANYTIRDAAFTTTKNRVAAKGFINFSKDSLDLSVALLNKNGCSIFSQRVYGDLDSPTLGSVKVVRTILAPVTNLVDDILGIECVAFYNGTVKQPK